MALVAALRLVRNRLIGGGTKMEVVYFVLALIAMGIFAAIVLSTGVVILILATAGLVVSFVKSSAKELGKRAEHSSKTTYLREQHQT